MTNTPEQLDELIKRAKRGVSLSYQKDTDPSMVNIVSILNHIPKAEVPQPNLMRIRNKVLDRISLPSEKETYGAWSGIFRGLPRAVKLAGGFAGGFMILMSLTLGTAVASLESVPGQTIYPVKKIVENVQMKMAGTEEEKTNLQIKFANNRVDELETILQKNKEGKVSGAQVQKVVASTTKDLQKTTQTVADKSKDEPNVNLLAKIVTLSNKQAAVIQAAQVESEGEVKIELQKALDATITSKEQAIQNIEKAGLVVDEQPLTMEEAKDENAVKAEGKLTAVTTTTINIGSAQFLLTKETEYVNIKQADLKVGVIVEITGTVKDKKTYATKIELQSKPEPTPTPTPAPAPTDAPPTTEKPATEPAPAPAPSPTPTPTETTAP